jgi:uncharacterized membrane protein YdjX (TVP38/TMEM64 family)
MGISTHDEGERIRDEDFYRRRLVWIRLLLLLIVVWVAILIAYETRVVEFFLSRERLKEFIGSLGPIGFIGFILLQAMQVVAAPIPGEVTGLLGGYLYGPVLGVVISTIGLTIGSYFAFALSRYFGRPFVERFVSKTVIDRFDYLLRHKGYVLGLGHLSTAAFLVIGGTGRLFGTILLTLGGAFIRNKQYAPFFILTGVALIVVLLALAYRDRIERLLRLLHVREYQRRRAKRSRKGSP